MILVGNKTDLENLRSVSYDQGKQLAYQEGIKFFETSALKNENVNKVLKVLVHDMYELAAVEIKNKGTCKFTKSSRLRESVVLDRNSIN
jgi:Ras-related protein Rab-1A